MVSYDASASRPGKDPSFPQQKLFWRRCSCRLATADGLFDLQCGQRWRRLGQIGVRQHTPDDAGAVLAHGPFGSWRSVRRGGGDIRVGRGDRAGGSQGGDRDQRGNCRQDGRGPRRQLCGLLSSPLCKAADRARFDEFLLNRSMLMISQEVETCIFHEVKQLLLFFG